VEIGEPPAHSRRLSANCENAGAFFKVTTAMVEIPMAVDQEKQSRSFGELT
jgi:hypothetical protein